MCGTISLVETNAPLSLYAMKSRLPTPYTFGFSYSLNSPSIPYCCKFCITLYCICIIILFAEGTLLLGPLSPLYVYAHYLSLDLVAGCCFGNYFEGVTSSQEVRLD